MLLNAGIAYTFQHLGCLLITVITNGKVIYSEDSCKISVMSIIVTKSKNYKQIMFAVLDKLSYEYGMSDDRQLSMHRQQIFTFVSIAYIGADNIKIMEISELTECFGSSRGPRQQRIKPLSFKSLHLTEIVKLHYPKYAQRFIKVLNYSLNQFTKFANTCQCTSPELTYVGVRFNVPDATCRLPICLTGLYSHGQS